MSRLLENLQAVISIILIDLALSGDNALVIGLAARGLPVHQRRQAILLGGLAAVLLRIVAASAVTLLLAIPYLQAVAAVALVVIAYRLVRPSDAQESGGHVVKTATTLREAVITILVADAVMSLENVLGVGAAAHGSIPLLAFGLALSIPIVLFGSDLVARLVQRCPWGIWLGVIALLGTAATMVRHEPALHLADLPAYAEIVVTLTLVVGIVIVRMLVGSRARRRGAAETPAH